MGHTEEQLELHIAVIISQSWTIYTVLSCQDPSYNYAQPMPPMGYIAQEIRHLKLEG